jgi:hypothetical protein
MEKACSTHGRKDEHILGVSASKILLVRPVHECEDDIEMDLTEVSCGCMRSIDMGRNRGQQRGPVKTVMSHGPMNRCKFLEICRLLKENVVGGISFSFRLRLLPSGRGPRSISCRLLPQADCRLQNSHFLRFHFISLILGLARSVR